MERNNLSDDWKRRKKIMDLTEGQSIMDWARQVEPEGHATRSKLESDRFIADSLARNSRVAYACIDAVMADPGDDTDDLL